MGGRSPLLEETEAQRAALEAELKRRDPDTETRVFVAMRYWKPFAAETARAVAAFGPDETVLLPLYPQFSTTTTASSLKAWAGASQGRSATRAVCCYPEAPGLVDAIAAEIRKIWDEAGRPENIRLLFSAHGLPQRVVDAGDPYRAMDNVVITPHLGYVSTQNYARYFTDIVGDIRAFLDGKPVRIVA